MGEFQAAEPIEKRLFRGRFRYFILLLGFLCTAAISANMNAFNFTLICMRRGEDGSDAPSDNSTSANPTTRARAHAPYFTETEKAILMWVPSVSTLLFALPFNAFYSHFGARVVLTVSGISSALLMLLFPLAVHFGMGAIIVVRFLQGVTYAADFSAMGVLCADWAPLAQIGVFISALSTYTPASAMVANTVSGMLCVSRFGWPAVYYGFAAVTVLITVLWAIYYSNPAESAFLTKAELAKIHAGKSETHKKANKHIPYREIMASKLVWIIWFNAFVELCAGSFFLMYKPSYFKYALNYSIEETGFLTSFSLFFHIPLKIVLGHFSDRITFMSERAKLILFNTVGVGLPALAYVGVAFAPTPAFAVFCFVMNGLFFAASGGGFFKCASLCARQYSHFVIGNVQISKCLALFVCPALVAIFVSNVEDQHQWRVIFIIFAVLTFAWACLNFLSYRVLLFTNIFSRFDAKHVGFGGTLRANLLFCCVATDRPLEFTERNDHSTLTTRNDRTHF